MGITEEIKNKLANNQYISIELFQRAKDDGFFFDSDFDLDSYNNKILDKGLIDNKLYFDTILSDIDPNINLDDEQRRAILADESQALIIAGAGTGKTTTMVAKVKYLVEKQKVDADKILVLSYARKNVEELRDKINVALDIPVNVSTFHSLGYKYVKNIFLHGQNRARHCYIVEEGERSRIFLNFLKSHIYDNVNHMQNFYDCFNKKTLSRHKSPYGSFFEENFQNYSNFDAYFVAYKNHKIMEAANIEQIINDRIDREINGEHPRTIRGERVKSKGEAIIANYLFSNNISYTYEEIYDEILPDNDTYKPDFTLNIGGEKIYVEYFGLSDKRHGSAQSNYDKIRAAKESYHRQQHNKFISLDYKPNQDYLNDLKDRLQEFGFTFKPKTANEIYLALLDNNPLVEIFNIKALLYEIIDTIKTSPSKNTANRDIQNFLKNMKPNSTIINQARWVIQFYAYYQIELQKDPSKIGFDYADLIYYSCKYIDRLSAEKFNYEYIIIDEYQDISFERYDLAHKTVNRTGAKILAIGDDWQTIYSFSGSRIDYIYNFKKFFPFAKIFKITKTYRNAQSLVNYAGRFIMKNPSQIEKKLVSQKNIRQPFYFKNFSNDPLELCKGEYQTLKDIILQIHNDRPEDTILVLSRNNSHIKKLFKSNLGFRDELDTKVSIDGVKNFLFDVMTIHKAKGLTTDWTIVIGLNKGFPQDEHKDFWIKELFKQKPAYEGIEFAEERRILYVALTRSRYRVFLLRNTNPKYRSPFLDELWDMVNGDENYI